MITQFNRNTLQKKEMDVMFKKLVITSSIVLLSGCAYAPEKGIGVNVYSQNKIFGIEIGQDDKVVVDDLIVIKRQNGSRAGFHFDYLNGKPDNFDSKSFFSALYGNFEGDDFEINSARKVIFKNVVEHKDVSNDDGIAFYFKYADGIEKVVVFNISQPDRYLIIETKGEDAMELFNKMRSS